MGQLAFIGGFIGALIGGVVGCLIGMVALPVLYVTGVLVFYRRKDTAVTVEYEEGEDDEAELIA